MRDRFIQIYETNEWGRGSGEGSFAEHNRGYASFLQSFLVKHTIKTVVDLGCGDWQFSRFINWNGIDYRGFDVVPNVVKKNNEAFSKANVQFDLCDDSAAHLPEADLLIAKDVLQHWSNERIKQWLPTLSRYKFALITNCINPEGKTIPTDIEDGAFRYLDIRQKPFDVPALCVYSFTNSEHRWWKIFSKPRWKKNVLLVSNR